MDAIITSDLAAIIRKELREHVIRKYADRSRDREGTTIEGPNSSEENSLDEKNPMTANANSRHSNATSSPDEGKTLPSDLAFIENAYDHRVLYVIGKEEMKIRGDAPFWRKILLSAFLFVRHNSRSKMANLKVPTEKLVEIGFLKDI